MNHAKIPKAEYQAFAKEFNPVKFNADEWVKIAKDGAGTSKTAAQHADNVYAIWVASHYPGGQNPRWHINFRKPGANRMNLA